MGEQFGHYRLDELLGRGGMGEVHRAYDTVRRRTVALKRLSADQPGRPEFETRFRRESLLAAQLSAPNVIPIHDFGEIDGRLYLDDPRGDVYALACVLYECLTGRPPFGAGDPAAQVGGHLHGPPPRPGAVRPELAPFDEVIAAGMAKQPEARTPSAGALARAAAQALDPAAGPAAHPLPIASPRAGPPATAAWTDSPAVRPWAPETTARPGAQLPGPPPTLVPGSPSAWPLVGPTADPAPTGAPPRRRTGLVVLLVVAALVAVASAAAFLLVPRGTSPSPVDDRPHPCPPRPRPRRRPPR